MSYDELELDRMGDWRTATFFCISDTDSTYNFLVALAFSQMFNLLCERADNVHGGRLPHHVRVLGRRAGDRVQVDMGGGRSYWITIRSIEKGTDDGSIPIGSF